MSRSKFNIRFLSIAEEDFAEIVTYIAKDNIAAADKIEKGLEQIALNPLLGKIPADSDLKLLGFRYLIVENYLIFYTREKTTILIHRIFHGAKNYKAVLG